MSQQSSPVPRNTVEAELDLQHRLGRFAKAIAITCVVMFVASLVTHIATRGELSEGESTVLHEVLHLVTFVLAVGVWMRCRFRPMRRPTIEAIDAALTIAAGAIFALGGVSGSSATGIPVAFSLVLAMAYVVVGRSIVVPSSARRTLWISGIAVTPSIVFFAAHQMKIEFATARSENIFVTFTVGWLVFAAIVASASSRQLFGLRATIREIGKLGQYTLEAKIGEGGMGTVYRATHAMLRRPAAIKLLPHDRSSPADLARFEREVQLTTRLSHPNTISIFDYGRTPDGVFYYVMEYLDGLDLDRLVAAVGPIPPPRAIHILAQVAGSLAEAHALGLVHRDIKPANIVLTARADEPDVIKVLDFGLVRSLDQDQARSLANAITGTPLYLAPEAISAPDSVDARADLYALGAVAYFLLTGTHVFEGATVLELCSKHLVEPPQPPSQRLGASLPGDLEAIVMRCLAKQRDERPASAAAVRASLLACSAASQYDAEAAARWWQERGAELRRPSTPVSGTAPTMTIALGDRAA